MSEIKTIEDLIGAVSKMSPADLDYQLRKLQGIREWGLEQLGVDYRAGDRVQIRKGYELKEFFKDGTPHGWWPSRECLAPGATAVVKEIDYNLPHRFWYASIVLDREWTVFDRGNGEEVRHWYGPVDETPEGFNPPSPYDQERYPEGRKHTFGFGAVWLEKAPAEPLVKVALCDTCPHQDDDR